MTDYLASLGDDDLARLNLERDDRGYRIVWPQNANIYNMTLAKHLGPNDRDRVATIHEAPDGSVEHLTFAEIHRRSTNLASSLRGLGYGRGDFIAIHTGQHPDTVISHMAICLIGGTAVTLSHLYGPETIAHAMNDCRAAVLITGDPAWSTLRPDASDLFPHIRHVLTKAPAASEFDLADMMETDSADFVPELTGADDPALLMYTSGSTGRPKGILHGHRILAAYTPSIHLFFNLSMEDTDAVFYSPSDWAWVGGLLDNLFPAMMAGRPVVAAQFRFRPEAAYPFLSRHGVTHAFLAPTAIKRLAQTANPREKYDLKLRVICTGGEALSADTLAWAEDELGVVCNEFYGMTEINHLIGNCAALFPRRPGSMGRAYPGHSVMVVDPHGHEVGTGVPGEIVTLSSSPTRFIGYLNNPGKEAEMKLGHNLRTNDLAARDDDGYFWHKGRGDDLIKSSGFRIGPTEIEDCLLSHPNVAEVGVVGKPDSERGAVVKAFVRVPSGIAENDELAAELIEHVKSRLAGYKAPREIEFVDEFAMTTSGKIDRRALREAAGRAAGGQQPPR